MAIQFDVTWTVIAWIGEGRREESLNIWNGRPVMGSMGDGFPRRQNPIIESLDTTNQQLFHQQIDVIIGPLNRIHRMVETRSSPINSENEPNTTEEQPIFL